LVDEKLRKIEAEQKKSGESSDVTAGFLSYLLSTDMPIEEIHANISELMLAAVDTVRSSIYHTTIDHISDLLNDLAKISFFLSWSS
jgi:hypothetical protein